MMLAQGEDGSLSVRESHTTPALKTGSELYDHFFALLSQGYPKGGAGSISCGRPRGTYGWQQHGQRGRYRSDARRATRALVLGTEC